MTESNTRSGIPLKSVYAHEDVKNQDYDKHLGALGDYPYTRGRSARATGGWMQLELSNRKNSYARRLCGKWEQSIPMPQPGIRGMLTAVNKLGKGNREHGLDNCRC